MPGDFKERIRVCNLQDGLSLFPGWKREKDRYKPSFGLLLSDNFWNLWLDIHGCQ